MSTDESSDQTPRGGEARIPNGPTTPDDHSGLTEGTRIAIPLGIALITGAFVALGIQGDLLSRLMRNSPTMVIAAFALAVVGVVVPLFALLVKGKVRTAAFALGALLLLVGTVVAIMAGVSGTGIREQPTVSVVAKAKTSAPTSTPSGAQTASGASSLPKAPASSAGSMTVQITATGSSLASNDRMLLRVVAFQPTIAVDVARTQCSNTVMADVDPKAGRVLFWGEAGPSATGGGTSSITLSVSQTEFRYLCAHAVLSARPGTDGSAGSFTTTLVDVRNLEPLPSGGA